MTQRYTNGVCFTLVVTELFIHELSFLLPCSNAPVVYLTLYTNNLLHMNNIHIIYHNTILTGNMNNASTQASVEQVTEADWIRRPRDGTCAEASRTRPTPSYVSTPQFDMSVWPTMAEIMEK